VQPGTAVVSAAITLQALFIAGLAWTVMREKPSQQLLIMLPVVLGGVVLVSGGCHLRVRRPGREIHRANSALGR